MILVLILAVCALCATACGPAPNENSPVDAGGAGLCENFADAATRPDGRVVSGPFITTVVSFSPGPGASFGHDRMPDVVLGPPQGGGASQGGTDVVSLGQRGEIVVAFDGDIVDGPGDDFTVFENPFNVAGSTLLWDELAEVSVSPDGEHWQAFACTPAQGPPFGHCAGWRPVFAMTNGPCALDSSVSGGDGFDLHDLGLSRVRYVRIKDLATRPIMPPSTGFDLDAIAVLHSG